MLRKVKTDEEGKEGILKLSWLTNAVRRTVIVEMGEMTGCGSIINRSVIISGLFGDQIKSAVSFQLYLRPIVSQFYPEEVSSPVEVNWGFDENLKLCLVVPGHRPIAPSFLECRPDVGEYLLLVSGCREPLVLELSEIIKSSYSSFAKKLSLMHIDVESGIPASLLYRMNGDVAGIAITSTSDDKVLAIPAYEVLNFYHHHAGFLRETKTV